MGEAAIVPIAAITGLVLTADLRATATAASLAVALATAPAAATAAAAAGAVTRPVALLAASEASSSSSSSSLAALAAALALAAGAAAALAAALAALSALGVPLALRREDGGSGPSVWPGRHGARDRLPLVFLLVEFGLEGNLRTLLQRIGPDERPAVHEHILPAPLRGEKAEALLLKPLLDNTGRHRC